MVNDFQMVNRNHDSSDSDDENEHMWQDVDLNTHLDDGFGDLKPQICTFKRNEIPKGIYQYKGIYHKTSPQYVPGRGISKYHHALKNLIPVRRTKNKEKERLGVDEASLFSFLTFSWLSRFMYKAYRKGLTLDDVPEGSPLDSCDFNAQRLEKLWNDEVSNKGLHDASLGRVVWKFIRTRVICSCLVFTCNLITGFISVTICMRCLIKFAENPNASYTEGLKWAALLGITELFRTMFYSTTWAISYRTAVRLRSACLALLYKKIVRLNSLGDNSIGGLINLFANDCQRIFDMVLFGPMILGGPITITFGIIYIFWLLGPWALFGMLVFTGFYPIQYGMSRCTGFLRAKTMVWGDKRIRLVSEILSCIKLIKMYAWEKSFSKDLNQIRSKEIRLLHFTAYCQSLTMSLATTVPIISAIVTFISHVAAGNNLIPSEAFVVKTYCMKMLDPLLLFSGEGWKTFFDSLVSIKRLQAFSVQSVCFKQFRGVMTHLRDGWRSIVDGSIGLERMKTFPLVSLLITHYRVSLNNLRYGTENIIDARVSISRIKKILLLGEITNYIRYPMDRTQGICIADGTFCHGSDFPEEVKIIKKKSEVKSQSKLKSKKVNENSLKNEKDGIVKESQNNTVLFNINFHAQKGSLIGICGQVGSGKTTLLHACLGQLKVLSGNVYREGSCALVSQQAWILNATLRDNVLFGEPFYPSRYIKALNCCSLNNDINELPGGDETEIGERGINLSGGQKQRVALARALYADRDIYFLDDPLSAVDANVGSHIFNNYILGALKEKTVIFVTHQVQFLSKCDVIYVMKEGRIVERGPHSQLIENENGEYASMVNTWQESQNEKEVDSYEIENLTDTTTTTSGSHVRNRYDSGPSQDDHEAVKGESKPSDVKLQSANGNSVDNSGVLTKKEYVGKGSLNNDTYFTYMAAAGGLLVSLGVVLVMLFNVGTIAFSSWWLAHWLKAGSGGKIDVNNQTMTSENIALNPDFEMYKTVYASTIIVILLSNFIRGFLFTKVTLRASKRLHNDLFNKIIYSPMYFFEQTPIGRIQNIFSKDVDEVDARLPVVLESMLQDGWNLVFAVLFICLVFQWFIVPLIFISVIYYSVSKIFRVAVRDLKRFENTTRSPIFSLVAETVQGLDTIHAFGKENDFIRKFTKMFDQNSTCLYMCCIAMRWLSLRIDSLSVMITCITAIMVTIFHGQVSPALAGLAVAYSSTISGIFQYTIRLAAEVEMKFISVERINSYLQTLEKEGGHRKCAKPPNNWPTNGSVRFQNVCLQYRPGLPLVLRNISFKINSGEKIGIVGRTGAGKSSLTVALFRLVELCNGSIKINNIDVSTLELEQLRANLSIIPQDPILFAGTVRSNLDPFGKSNDAELWEILEKTHLKERIKVSGTGLDMKIGFSGDNLSVGECQLLCLARALLRKCKILILDEATAAIDPDTEAAIQETISKEFANCTVLTIAHRLATVTSCDRIILMDQGQVAEMDKPSVLLENPNSKFYQMMEASKEANRGATCR